MTQAFSDQDRTWVIFDTCTRPDYYRDVHRLLAGPCGWVMRYDYREQLLADDVVKAIRGGEPLPGNIVFAFAQIRTKGRGEETPTGTSGFADMLWVPTRYGEMLSVVESGGKFLFDFRLGDYPPLDLSTVVRELLQKHQVPFEKWVAFTGQALAPKQQASDDDASWRAIVETLTQPPSIFAGDAFWRIRRIKRSGTGAVLEPALVRETDANQIRQVTSSYQLVDGSSYAVEVVTCRSARGRTGGAPTEYTVDCTSDDENLRVIGPGRMSVRQYTADHFGLETESLTIPQARPAEVGFKTSPPDGVWPQGPELQIRFVIRKRLRTIFFGLTALALGTATGMKQFGPLMHGDASWQVVFFGVASVILVVLGATVWLGKFSTK